MPKTKLEKILFSLLMAAVMVYGMEVYNKFIQEKTLEASHLLLNPLELLLLMAAVIALETVIGGPLARKAAQHFIKSSTKPIFIIAAVQICTVCLMCPMMSLVASLVFKCGFSSQLLPTWIQTVGINLPMAMLWQLLIAEPLVRLLVLHLPKKSPACVPAEDTPPTQERP